MARHTRYQGAIIRDHHILLIRYRQHSMGRSYWIIPGGGLEGDETEEACVIREMKEETNLNVVVERLVFDEPGHPDGIYERRKTYLCWPVGGVAKPGYEPELEMAADSAIVEVRWFDLRDDRVWDPSLCQDPFTYPQLERLREVLGYVNRFGLQKE